MGQGQDKERCRSRWVDQVLEFWFEELGPGDWFRVNSAVDDAITERFSDLHNELAGTPIKTCLRSADVMLASVIVLDQFSRNLYRNKPQAFAFDGAALELAQKAVAQGLDQEVLIERRAFVYLPFEHSETLADQDRAIELITALDNDVLTQYAHAHRKVIATFGRFPHRNSVLGRSSTPAEDAYLAEPGSGF